MDTLFATTLLAVVLTGPAEQRDNRLVVRVYDAAGVPAPELEEARVTLSEIFQASRVDVRWRVCPQSADVPSPDVCDDLTTANDVILRLVAAPLVAPARTAKNVLGYSHSAMRRLVESRVTVFVNRVRTTAARAGIDSGTLLGRVIGHELGHVLLGASHSESGLMRAKWKLNDLRTDRSTRWLFTPRETLNLRRMIFAGFGDR